MREFMKQDVASYIYMMGADSERCRQRVSPLNREKTSSYAINKDS